MVYDNLSEKTNTELKSMRAYLITLKRQSKYAEMKTNYQTKIDAINEALRQKKQENGDPTAK